MKTFYVKTESEHHKKKAKKKYFRSAGIFLISVGILLFLYFLFPIVSYQIFIASAFSDTTIETPIPKYLISRNGSFGSLISQGISSLTTDYNDARNWYPQVSESITQKKEPAVTSYSLAIPKLKIENATVSTVDYD